MSPCNIKIFYFQEFFRAHHEFSDNFFMSDYFTVCDLRAITKNIAQSLYQRQNRETSWKFVVRRRRHQIKLRRSLLGQALHWRDRCRIYSDFFFEAVRDFNFVINDTAQRNMLRFFSFYFFSWATQQRYLNQHSFKLHKSQGCWVRDDDDDRLLAFIHFSSQCVYLKHMLCSEGVWPVQLCRYCIFHRDIICGRIVFASLYKAISHVTWRWSVRGVDELKMEDSQKRSSWETKKRCFFIASSHISSTRLARDHLKHQLAFGDRWFHLPLRMTMFRFMIWTLNWMDSSRASKRVRVVLVLKSSLFF